MIVGGSQYDLIQFHFHEPSEEMIDGKPFDMVAHLVHRDTKGHLAVVAVPLRSGGSNSFIARLWRYLPKAAGAEMVVKDVSIDAAQLLPTSLGYYAYEGSLTTPPCSEGVRWFVLKTPSNISIDDVRAFHIVHGSNVRPVQPLNGREVLSTK
jgi:carbonic anhydrase